MLLFNSEPDLASLRDLLIHELKDLYSAEEQILEILPEVVEGATDPDLKKEIRSHLDQATLHKQRLDKVGAHMGFDLKGETCPAMKGLIKEMKSMLKKDTTDPVRDAGIIASGQRIVHYEIAAYGVSLRFAKCLNLPDVAELLADSLSEQQSANRQLIAIAEGGVDSDAKREGIDCNDRSQLEYLTKDELYERAKEKDIEGRSTMTKDQLVSALCLEKK